MKVIGLTGSPRKNGNTAKRVARVLAGAVEQGAEVAHYPLNDMEIKGCQACGHCKSHEGCVIDDDMQKLYTELREASAVVFASPVYMDQISAQTKLFLDRLYAMMTKERTPKLKTNPKMVIAVTQANPNLDAYRPYFDTLKTRMERFGFRVSEMIIAGGTHGTDDILDQADLMERAQEAGRDLTRG